MGLLVILVLIFSHIEYIALAFCFPTQVSFGSHFSKSFVTHLFGDSWPARASPASGPDQHSPTKKDENINN